jgi:hypothetical protein
MTMPAETHQQRDAVTAEEIEEEIIDLLVSVLTTSTGLADVGPDARLASLGVDSDLARFDLGNVVAEEYGERGLGGIDLDELGSAHTIGEMASLFARQWARAGEQGDPTRREEPT